MEEFCCSGVESTPGNLPRWDHRWKQTSFVIFIFLCYEDYDLLVYVVLDCDLWNFFLCFLLSAREFVRFLLRL